jgi:hypothetical protein
VFALPAAAQVSGAVFEIAVGITLNAFHGGFLCSKNYELKNLIENERWVVLSPTNQAVLTGLKQNFRQARTVQKMRCHSIAVGPHIQNGQNVTDG